MSYIFDELSWYNTVMSEKIVPKDISKLPVPEILTEINNIADNLKEKQLLPEGLVQLIFDSTQGRVLGVFLSLDKYKDIPRGDLKLEELYNEWKKDYDGYSGKNLAETALSQHEKDKSKNESFPIPNTPDFINMVEQMNEMGKYLKELNNRLGWHRMFDEIVIMRGKYN